jgi:hypothetical protein
MEKNNNINLPVTLVYSDDIDLVQKMLKLYTGLGQKLTQRNIDMLTLCILADMNSKDFNSVVIESAIGTIKTVNQVTTEMSRLRSIGLLYKDPIKMHDHLEPRLKKIKELIDQRKNNISITVRFEKKKKR